MVSCRQKGPTRHAYAWQIGPFWQDTLDMLSWNMAVSALTNPTTQATIQPTNINVK